MNARITAVTLAAVAAIAGFGLAGCSTGGTTPKPTPSSSSTPDPVAESVNGEAPKTGVCDHGQMTIVDGNLAADRTLTISTPCDHVAIVASDAEITLDHDIAVLTIEGSNNTVTAEHVERSLGMGGNNVVQHTGTAPEKVAGDDDTTDYQQR